MFTQDPYRCRLDWGRQGTRMAAERGDILVVVDVLSFSTATITAISNGGIIYPCSYHDEDPALYAQRLGAELAVSRQDVPAKGRFSLAPATFEQIEPGTRVVLASPNGGTCSYYGRKVPYLFVGALVNARATAAAVTSLFALSD